MHRTVIIIRSCSGAGKTTFANYLKQLGSPDGYGEVVICEADDYFLEKYGVYRFSPQELGAAHNWCQEKFRKALEAEIPLVIVSNTSTKTAEVDIYLNLAKKFNYTTFCLVMENRNETKNSHQVPEKSLINQEKNLRNNLKLL